MRYRYYLILFVAFLSMQCTPEPQKIGEVSIIPKPLEVTIQEGNFVFEGEIYLTTNFAFHQPVQVLREFLYNNLNITTTEVPSHGQKISFYLVDNMENEEAYHLRVQSDHIEIAASNVKGAFYAVQSLLQLFPATIDKSKLVGIPAIEIRDEPRFKYRGMHLDVGRHMYSVEFIKKYIDQMSKLKMNTFHWHLTEDQGWRIEIKKYPKLQQIAAFRKETLVGHYSDQPHEFDGIPYGGFYTQEQIKEIVAYASARQITIIPEIEMPGHSQAAIAAHPELGCTNEQVEVATKWGVFEEVYCPTETTFQFLEDVIDEVVELFPGKYIHIGGDEAPKTRWKNCSYCQKLIREKRLKDEHGLQSYFIQRMEKYINSKGKQIIGWDEILEGGLAPNATVMSWRGTQGAVEAAKEGHDVILTPTSHCYFDYYQSENENEPLAIGGFLPLEKVYSFDPIPKELTAEESQYVLGAQGNVWTEYMPDAKQVEYMAFPRMIALSEVVWSAPEQRDYKDFVSRLEQYQKRLDQWDVNYANHIYEVKGALKNNEGKLTYELTTTSDSYPIYYSIDDTEPTIEYKKPIEIETSMKIKAAVKERGRNLGSIFEEEINLHKGVGATITIDKEPHPSYNAGGKEALINGISGSDTRYGDKEWLGFWGEDIVIKIERDPQVEISNIKMRFFVSPGQWIYEPKEVWVYAPKKPEPPENESDVVMGFSFEQGASLLLLSPYDEKSYMEFEYYHEFASEVPGLDDSPWIEIRVKNYGIIPEGLQGAGNKAWTFIDEIIIE